MRRRDVLTWAGGVAIGPLSLWPLGLRAKQLRKPEVGFLGSTSQEPYVALVAAFRAGLKAAGYEEGHNVVIQYRWADNQPGRLPALAADLVSRRVAVIATSGSVPPALAAKGATSSIPIVFHIGADPVAAGLVPSLNRPGGNITGVSFLTYAAASKRLGLIRDLFPSIKVLGLLIDPNDPVAESVVTELETAIRPFGITLRVVRAGSDHELDQAFVSLAQNKVGAVIVNTDPFYRTRMNEIVSLAAQHAIPDMYSGRDYAVAGGLVGYGADIAEAYRQQGVYVGKILNGEKPGDLPVLQSTKFEFVINLKTAKRLGLTLPSALLSIADDLIE